MKNLFYILLYTLVGIVYSDNCSYPDISQITSWNEDGYAIKVYVHWVGDELENYNLPEDAIKSDMSVLSYFCLNNYKIKILWLNYEDIHIIRDDDYCKISGASSHNCKSSKPSGQLAGFSMRGFCLY